MFSQSQHVVFGLCADTGMTGSVGFAGVWRFDDLNINLNKLQMGRMMELSETLQTSPCSQSSCSFAMPLLITIRGDSRRQNFVESDLPPEDLPLGARLRQLSSHQDLPAETFKIQQQPFQCLKDQAVTAWGTGCHPPC